MPPESAVEAFIAQVVSGDHVGAIRDWRLEDAWMQENQAAPRLAGRQAQPSEVIKSLKKPTSMIPANGRLASSARPIPSPTKLLRLILKVNGCEGAPSPSGRGRRRRSGLASRDPLDSAPPPLGVRALSWFWRDGLPALLRQLERDIHHNFS